ncbi:MAG: hypothetical protein CMH81_02285 [Nitrospiraceae bacterium]|nr:hypothetical protein [Nitrospiraceae bacterium]
MHRLRFMVMGSKLQAWAYGGCLGLRPSQLPMMSVPWLRTSLLFLGIFLLCGVAWAMEDQDSDPIVITSQSLVVHNRNDQAIFEGQVMLIQGAFRLTADRMVVFFADQAASNDPGVPAVAGQKISMIKAVGHVKIVDGDQSATGKKAVFYGKEEKVVLTGQPEIWQHGYRVTGKKLTLFLKEDRSVVEGGSQVVITDSGSLNLGASAEDEH